MKKRHLAAGLIGSFFAGAVVYNKIKNAKDYNVLMYPMCRVTVKDNGHVYDIDELISNSEVVVTGYVERVEEPRWNNSSNMQPKNILSNDVIYKDYIIKIDNSIKGLDAAIDTIKLRSFEGSINNFTVEDDSQVVLSEGERVTAFLVQDKSPFNKRNSTDYYVPLGDKQGVFIHMDDYVKNSASSIEINEFDSIMQLV